MKKTLLIIAYCIIALSTAAQTLNVAVGDVTYQFPASQTGDMIFASGNNITVMGKTFAVDDITNAFIDETVVTDGKVTVIYSGNTAKVTVAGNIAKYVTPTLNGAHVSIAQSAEVGENNVGEITYTLMGETEDGEFYLTGSYKTTVELNGLRLTNANPVYSGAAINIQNGKRVDVSIKKETVNTLTDAAGGDQKACFVIKGHAEFKGKGTLNVHGKQDHGIKTGEYMTVKNCTINVLEAPGDGIHSDEYFLMESGKVNINGVQDDGIQAEIDGSESTGMTDGHEDEDSGNIYINGGDITIAVTALAAKGVKADGDIVIEGGTINVSTTGNSYWDNTNSKVKGSAALHSEGNTTVNGGTLTLASSGGGGKGMSGDGTLTITGGDITISASGGIAVYETRFVNNDYIGNTDRISSNKKCSPKGIKFDGDINIGGGTVNVTSAKHEGIESKGIITIDGGYIESVCKDDALNSGSHLYIKGGYIYAVSNENDAIDSNGNMYLSGGNIFAGGREEGFDANSERGYKLYVQSGASFMAVGASMGALEGGAVINQNCYQYSPGQAGTIYGLKSGSNPLFAVTLPTISGGPGGPGGGGGPSNTKIVCTAPSTPELYSDVTGSGTALWSGKGYTSFSGGSKVTLTTYTGGGGWPW